MKACAECLRSCSSLHKTKLDPYPIVSSFFKVMFDKQFSEFLILPPKFAKTVLELVGKSTYIEDQTGQKWKVNLSYVNGSLAFQQGWHEFSKDHTIELGDFLVFHYFKGSHFSVQIYARSGCEKPIIFRDKDYQNKRAKLAKDSDDSSFAGDCSYQEAPAKECLDSYIDPVPDVDIIQTKDAVKEVEKSPEINVNDTTMEVKTNNQPSVEIPATDFLLESCLMTDSNAGLLDDSRNDLLDLSVFEMPEKKPDAVKMSLQNTQTKVASPDVIDCDIDEDTPKTSNEANRSRKETVSLPNDAVSRANTPFSILVPLKPVTLPYTPQFSTSAASFQTPCKRMKIVKQDPKSGKIVSDSAVVSNHSQYRAIFSINKDHIIKNNSLDNYHKTCMIQDKGQKGMIVRNLQALNLCDSSSGSDTKITSLVKNSSETFLELPRPLPVKASDQGTVSPEQKLVFLRDPVKRLWPVIYHQRKGINALAHGWKEFRRSNGIQTGDRCTFVVENIDEHIFQVHISSQNLSQQTPVIKIS